MTLSLKLYSYIRTIDSSFTTIVLEHFTFWPKPIILLFKIEAIISFCWIYYVISTETQIDVSFYAGTCFWVSKASKKHDLSWILTFSNLQLSKKLSYIISVLTNMEAFKLLINFTLVYLASTAGNEKNAKFIRHKIKKSFWPFLASTMTSSFWSTLVVREAHHDQNNFTSLILSHTFESCPGRIRVNKRTIQTEENYQNSIRVKKN